ncbi:MAG: 16S rRNA (uracil(1498)-N(3))-methyltransferase [Parvibaculum sp.]
MTKVRDTDETDSTPDNCGTGKVRLYVEADLGTGLGIVPSPEQCHYLLNVMRLKAGDSIRLFNGRDGEWQGELADVKKKTCLVALQTQTREQDSLPDIWLLFAPVKRARLDFMVQKAVEMGAARIMPVMTHRTNVGRVKEERLRANAIEAAEQCGLLSVPEISEPLHLSKLLDQWADIAPDRRIVFCDEAAPQGGVLDTLNTLRAEGRAEGKGEPFAILIGPEGGFSPHEREQLLARADTVPLSLGPRIMRADTAAVAALAIIQLLLGDWAP